MIVFESEYFELEFLATYGLLAVRWIGILQTEEVSKMIRQIIATSKEFQIAGILLDATCVEAPASIATLYQAPLTDHFQSKCVLPKVKKIARVASGHNHYDDTILRQYATLWGSCSGELEFRNFTHHYQAMEWLTSP